MNVQHLRQSPRFPRLHAVLPVMSVVRGKADSTTWEDADIGVGQRAAQARDIERVDGIWASGGGFAQTGERKDDAVCADWPGREYGIRAPHPQEKALSWAEVHTFLRIGALT